jgi:hypothetical protein
MPQAQPIVKIVTTRMTAVEMRLLGSDVKLPGHVFFGSSGTWRIGTV